MTEQQVQEQSVSETEVPAEEDSRERTFTQKDMDKVAGQRAKEAKKAAYDAAMREIAEKAGAESVDEVIAGHQSFKTIEEETQGEADKERKAREKAEGKLKELEPYKESSERYKAALEEHVTAQMEGLPEYLTPLLNGMDPVEKLTWLNENREKVTTPNETPSVPRGVPPTPVAHNTTQTEQDAAAQQARLDAKRSNRSRI